MGNEYALNIKIYNNGILCFYPIVTLFMRAIRSLKGHLPQIIATIFMEGLYNVPIIYGSLFFFLMDPVKSSFSLNVSQCFFIYKLDNKDTNAVQHCLMLRVVEGEANMFSLIIVGQTQIEIKWW